MKVDVVVLTKNSDYVLEKCLDSIYENIPLNSLIVVDGFSTDRTLNIVEKYANRFRNVVLVTDSGTRATARQRGIGLIETEWLAFVDSDVVLDKGWFKNVRKRIANDVGAVEGKPRRILPPRVSRFPQEDFQFEEAMKSLRRSITKKDVKLRQAFTGDTLIRTRVVKDIVIPPILHRFEDNYIKSHVLKKGYKWIHLDEEICDHYLISGESASVILEYGAYTRLTLQTTFKNLILNLVKSFPKGVFTALSFRNPRAVTYPLKYYWNYLVGWLKWKKVLT